MTSGKNNIEEQFSRMIESEQRDYKFNELMLSMRVLSEVERLMEERDINKAQLAVALEVSAPYITMLFKGEKILNLEKIARIQEFFSVDFKIQAESREATFSTQLVEDYMVVELDIVNVIQVAESTANYYHIPVQTTQKSQTTKALCS